MRNHGELEKSHEFHCVPFVSDSVTAWDSRSGLSRFPQRIGNNFGFVSSVALVNHLDCFSKCGQTFLQVLYLFNLAGIAFVHMHRQTTLGVARDKYSGQRLFFCLLQVERQNMTQKMSRSLQKLQLQQAASFWTEGSKMLTNFTRTRSWSCFASFCNGHSVLCRVLLRIIQMLADFAFSPSSLFYLRLTVVLLLGRQEPCFMIGAHLAPVCRYINHTSPGNADAQCPQRHAHCLEIYFWCTPTVPLHSSK